MQVCYCVPDYHGDRCQYQYDECQLKGRYIVHIIQISAVTSLLLLAIDKYEYSMYTYVF